MSDIHEDFELWCSIASVLNEDYTGEEKQLVDRWVSENDSNKRIFEQLNSLKYYESDKNEGLMVKDKIYNKVQSKIIEASLKVKLRIWQTITAASIVLFLVVGSIARMGFDSKKQIMIESKTPAGGTTSLQLNDGTLVSLNASSSIKYPYHFNGDVRLVNIHGEAYFEVAKNPKYPFVVEANNMRIEVLGTHFNIKAYDEDDKIITTLLEGSIKVQIKSSNSVKDKAIVLKPNQQLVFDKQTEKLSIVNVDADLYALWKDGQCFFENQPFFEITKILERHFGIAIIIHSTDLKNQRYSGVFTKKEGIIRILNSFKNIKNFTYKQTDKGIEIYEK